MCVAVCCISGSCSPPSASPTASTPLARPRPTTRLSKPPSPRATAGGDATRHIVDAGFLCRMKKRAVLINTSRGTLVRYRSRSHCAVDLGRGGPRRRRGRAPHRRRPSPREGAQIRMRFFELIPFFLVAGKSVTEGKNRMIL